MMVIISEGSISTVFLVVYASPFVLSCGSIQMLEVPNVFWSQRLYVPTLASLHVHSAAFHPLCSHGRRFLAHMWLQIVKESLQAENNYKSGALLRSPSAFSTPSCQQKSLTPCFLPRTINTSSSCCLHSLKV